MSKFWEFLDSSFQFIFGSFSIGPFEPQQIFTSIYTKKISEHFWKWKKLEMISENFVDFFFQKMRSEMLKIKGNPKGNCSLLFDLWTSSFKISIFFQKSCIFAKSARAIFCKHSFFLTPDELPWFVFCGFCAIHTSRDKNNPENIHLGPKNGSEILTWVKISAFRVKISLLFQKRVCFYRNLPEDFSASVLFLLLGWAS